jgi:transposase
MNHRLDNTESAITYAILSKIINKSKLNTEEINNLYDLNNTDSKKFIENIKKSLDINKDLKTSDIARILGKHCKTNSQSNLTKKRKIYGNYILNILENSNIKEYMSKERTIHLFLDKYSSNRSNLVKKVAQLLNINLIYLPPYSPHLNPIEQIWRLIKRELKHHYIYSKEHMEHIVKKEFYKNVLNFSIVENWYEKYIKIVR